MAAAFAEVPLRANRPVGWMWDIGVACPARRELWLLWVLISTQALVRSRSIPLLLMGLMPSIASASCSTVTVDNVLTCIAYICYMAAYELDVTPRTSRTSRAVAVVQLQNPMCKDID
jgi:hypothetical protein